MRLGKLSAALGRVTDPMAKGLNWVAGLFLAAMMVLTGTDVTLRYFLNRPIPGSYEITEYMMPVIVAFGLAFCQLEKEHVQVDLFTSLLPKRLQRLCKIGAHLLMATVYGVIAWQTSVRARELMVSGQYSEVLYIPIYPFVWVVCAGCAVFSLVALKAFLDLVSEAINDNAI
jgi:TRAP-type C4-dicarboxylate transport system permease small subunit